MREYLSLRHVLNAVALSGTLVIGYAVGLRGEAFAAILVVGLAKCVEAISQTYYGYFQKHERLDLVARSLLLRSLSGPLFFCIGLLLGHHLSFACAGLLVGWLIPQWLADRRSAKIVAKATGSSLGRGERTDWVQVRAMARTGAPLGIDAGLSSLAVNVPRYAIQVILGAASLGTYVALAYLAQTVQLVTASMAGAVIARLAVYHHQGRKRAFLRLLIRLTVFGMGILAVALLGALLVGAPFLRLTLGPEYVDQDLLIALLLAAGAITFQRSLCKCLEASWRFKTYVVVDAITTGAIAILSPFFVHAWGVMGAAVAMGGGFLIGSVAVGVALIDVVRRMPAVPPGSGIDRPARASSPDR
jgi:O-antigen/teichoic acid export membrane protein